MASKKKKPEGGSKRRIGKKRKRKRRRPRDLVDHSYMKALSKRERVEILAILCERVASPKEISEELDEGLSQVSYHVNVLRGCRLIRLAKTEPRRGAVEHFYCATTPTLTPPETWKHLPSAMRKDISIRIMQEFFEDASAAMEAGLFDESPGELSFAPLVLDPKGIEEFGELARGFLDSVTKLQAKADKRQPKDGLTTGTKTASVFLATFLSTRNPKNGKKAAATKRR